MQWAVAAHGPEGKVRADRRTVEYVGRGNHARDAACFRTTRPVSAAPHPHARPAAALCQASSQQTQQQQAQKTGKDKGEVRINKRGARAAAPDGRGGGDKGDRCSSDDAEALSLSTLRLFYYETLVVSTGDDDESAFGDGDGIEKDARAELDLLMARANAAAAAINSSSSITSGGGQHAATRGSSGAVPPHPYLSARTDARLPWRERARRIVHANLRAAESLVHADDDAYSSSSSDEDEAANGNEDDDRMELDSTDAAPSETHSNGNGNSESAGNGDASRNFGIREFLTSSSGGIAPIGGVSSGNHSSSTHHPRLLSLTTGGGTTTTDHHNSSQSRSRSSSNSSSTNNGISSSTAGISNSVNGVHFAFTLSSRTLQQIRSRHDRRRMRRHQEKKRFNHRIGIGFALASKSSEGLGSGGGDRSNGHEGLSQVSSSSSQSSSASHHSSAGMSSSPLKKLASYQQQQQRHASHEDLGKDAFSLAYHGKTGRIMSNGQVFLQCERFGSGDVVGCGILLDTKTFFFTLNGRLLGMLAATDVHHFDDFVDDSAASRALVSVNFGVHAGEDDASDAEFVADGEYEDDERDDTVSRDRDAALFEDVLYPAVSLHDAGECACANFDQFRFDLAGFERQIQKERQQALLMHEIADEREEIANDRVISKLIEDHFLHNGYKDAHSVFQKSAAASFLSDSHSVLDGDDIVVDDEEEKTESMDTEAELSLVTSDAAQTKLLDLRHAVRQHIYAFETHEALAKVCAALGDSFFSSTTRRRRSGKVLFYCRVLCVLDVLMAQQALSSGNPVNAKAGNGNAGGSNGRLQKVADHHGAGSWNVEEAILCAQEQFSSYLARSPARGTAPIGDSSSSATSIGTGGSSMTKSSDLVTGNVVGDELEMVMSLLLYAREADVPPASAARKFLSREFREHVADELNVLLLANSSSSMVRSPSSSNARHRQRRSSSARAARDASASALQRFLVELDSLQSQCLRNGCRVFPGNHTVSSGGKRASSRRRHHQHASASSSENGTGDGAHDDDEEMRSSSSGSDMSSSSSRSENDDDDDDDDDEEEEE